MLNVECTDSESTGIIKSMNFMGTTGEALTDHMYTVCIKQEHNSVNYLAHPALILLVFTGPLGEKIENQDREY